MVVREGGAFLVYQFNPKVYDFIKPHFAPIKRGFEWINVPPATLFWAYKGTSRQPELPPQIQSARHGIVHDVDEKVGYRPLEPPPDRGAAPVDISCDRLAVFELALEIAAHRGGKGLVLNPKHDLHVDVEAAIIEVRRADVDDIIDNGELGVKLGRLIFVHLNVPAEQTAVAVPRRRNRRIVVGFGCSDDPRLATPAEPANPSKHCSWRCEIGKDHVQPLPAADVAPDASPPTVAHGLTDR